MMGLNEDLGDRENIGNASLAMERNRSIQPGATRFLAGYIEAALFFSHDEENAEYEFLDRFGSEDIDSATYAKMVSDCGKFQADNAELLSSYYQTVRRVDDAPVEAYAGHDFLLSRNGHGAGFFDRDGVDQAVRDGLQDAAEKFCVVDLYAENGQVFTD